KLEFSGPETRYKGTVYPPILGQSAEERLVLANRRVEKYKKQLVEANLRVGRMEDAAQALSEQVDEQESLEQINLSLRTNLEEILQGSEQRQIDLETERGKLQSQLARVRLSAVEGFGNVKTALLDVAEGLGICPSSDNVVTISKYIGDKAQEYRREMLKYKAQVQQLGDSMNNPSILTSERGSRPTASQGRNTPTVA
ncbi:MAG: hypothetical protein GY795_24150, partial [Desulfobacterales bacterium]|nr:hypothetical protein [Desulfobacterales bacterium]